MNQQRGITIQQTGLNTYNNEALYTVTYHQTGEDPVSPDREWYWSDILGIQHRWIFDGVQTH